MGPRFIATLIELQSAAERHSDGPLSISGLRQQGLIMSSQTTLTPIALAASRRSSFVDRRKCAANELGGLLLFQEGLPSA